MLALVLTLCVFLQSTESRTVAVVVDNTTTVMKLEEAENKYTELNSATTLTQEEMKLLTALTNSLGSVPCTQEEILGIASNSSEVASKRAASCKIQRSARLL